VPRVGILGGAFNPPHVGHLVCAQEALIQLGLEKVLFVPVGEAPHRTLDDDPGSEVRLELVELAIRDDDRFEASRVELEREGPSYTADTLRQLHDSSSGDELFLILGGDQAAALPDWHEPEEVLALATVAVAERVSWNRNAIGIKIGRLRGSERVRYLDMPLMQISSTVIRRRLATGLPFRYLVPDAVAEQIAETGPYPTPAEPEAIAEAAATVGRAEKATG
jgi:nicotinate-nucleotide adenylyltransferase